MIRAYLGLAFGIWLAANYSVGAGVVTMFYAALWAIYWSWQRIKHAEEVTA